MNRTTTITGRIKRDSNPDNPDAGAFLISLCPPGETSEVDVWIPKSQVEEIFDEPNGLTTLEIPEWLAIEKEVV